MINNWYKKAAKLDDEGTDGSIFERGGDYAPNKADFTEVPFEWVRPIKNGRLTESMNTLLSKLQEIYPHISAGQIASSVNLGITMALKEECDKHESRDVMLHQLGYDCSSVLSKGPFGGSSGNFYSPASAEESDKIANMVARKLRNYFYKRGGKNG